MLIPGGYRFTCFSGVGQQAWIWPDAAPESWRHLCRLYQARSITRWVTRSAYTTNTNAPTATTYLAVDLNGMTPDLRQWYQKYTLPARGTLRFAVGHALRDSVARPMIRHIPQYQSLANQVGRLPAPSATDHNVVALIYNAQMQESTVRTPTEPTRARFDRADMLLAMERLHAFYMSRMGLNRPQGLSINGRPDFLGIAQWIFDIYLPARSAGFSQVGAFDIVVAAITRTDEWRTEEPGRAPL